MFEIFYIFNRKSGNNVDPVNIFNKLNTLQSNTFCHCAFSTRLQMNLCLCYVFKKKILNKTTKELRNDFCGRLKNNKKNVNT